MTDSIRIHCNQCGHMTKHGIRASHSKSSLDEIEDGPTFEEQETVEILECLGCEHLVVRRTYMHEAYTEATTEFYPPPISRPMPRWSRIIGIGVPGIIRDVLKEVYKALQADSPILATMGARTILDLVMIEKVGDKGSFEQKLEALERNGFVGKKKADEKQDKLANQNGDLIKKLEELQKKVLDEKVTSIAAVITYSLDEEVLDDRPANAGPILQETPRLEIAVSPKIENVSTLHRWSSRLTLENPKYHAISSTQTSSKRDLSNDGGPAFAEDRRFESFELSAPDLGRLADWQEVTMDGVFTAEPVDDWLLVMNKHAAPDSKQLSDSVYKASDRAQFDDSGIVVDAVPIIVELRLLINGRPLRAPGGWRGQLAIMKDSDQIRPRCVVKFPPAVGKLDLNGSQR